MWIISYCYLLKSLIIWFYISFHLYDTMGLRSLSSSVIKEVLYYHNIYRYTVTVGNIKDQPPASDMTLIKWNESLVRSLKSIPRKCIEMSNLSCPSVNVYKVKNKRISISKILKKWFNSHKYYDYFTNTCTKNSCEAYKKILRSQTRDVGCLIKEFGLNVYFVCQYAQRLKDRPYINGEFCSNCIGDNYYCYKNAFCGYKNECVNRSCDNLLMKPDDNNMQSDEMQFCNLPDVDCNINFYLHMCPQICFSKSTVSTSTALTSTEFKSRNQQTSFSDNEVCTLATVDCSVAFFKILCPKSCEGVLCRDPNIDCRNIFYVKCQKCQQLNEKMSDSKITFTTTMPSIESVIQINDPKCQDLQYDNYCIDRGEMCFHFSYKEWMKRLCCNTCKILEVCIDYLEFKNPGKCSEILSSGMCFNLWSQTFCRKTCKSC